MSKETKNKIFDDIEFKKLNVEQQAKFLWDKYKFIRSGKKDFSQKDADETYKEFTMDYKAFHEMFPVVLRYMCQLGQFNGKAFRRFLIKMRHKPPSNKEELIVDRNADYLRYLWEELNPKGTKQQSNIVWTDAYNILKKDFELYEAVEEEAKKKIKEQQEVALAQKKQELITLLTTFQKVNQNATHNKDIPKPTL